MIIVITKSFILKKTGVKSLQRALNLNPCNGNHIFMTEKDNNK